MIDEKQFWDLVKQKQVNYNLFSQHTPLTDERCSYNALIEYVSIRKLNSDLGGSNDGSTGPLAPMIALIKYTRNKVETGEYEDDIEPEFDSGSYDED